MSGSLSSLPSSSYSDGIQSKERWVDEAGTMHEIFRGLVFIRDAYLGDFLFDPGGRSDLRYRRFGVAYFCPECGEVWARIVFINSEGKQASFEAQRVSCEHHLDPWNKPGSLLAAGLEGLVDFLPAAALKREFNIYIKGE